MLNYDSIKQLAKQIGRSTKDLVALTKQNDPFYVGVPGRQREAEWFAEIWRRLGSRTGIHTRRIHYLILTPDGEPFLNLKGEAYENTPNDWALLNRASLSARYLDLIPLDALVDRRNDEPMIFLEPPMWTDDPDIVVSCGQPLVLLPDHDQDAPPPPFYSVKRFYSEQDYVVEVWIEKSTQNDWLVPLCRRRKVNLVVGIGESSEIQSRHLVERVHETGKPARIIYMSDFDPAGRSMPVSVARKLEYYIGKFDFDVDVTLNPLVLTEEQCQHYRLPRSPIEEKERRKDTFEEKFGAGATELDALEALHPGEMAELLDRELDRYLDPTLSERVQEVRWKLGHQLNEIEKKVIESWQEEIDQLTLEYDAVNDAFSTLEESISTWEESAENVWEKIEEELIEQKLDLPEKPSARPANEPDGFVLFDSKRDYLTQMDRYHEWQRR